MTAIKTSRIILRERFGSWVQIHPNYVAIMKIDEAYLFSYLVDKEYIVFTGHLKMSAYHRRMVDAGWFYAKMKTVIRETHLYARQQSRIFSRLEKHGFITTQRIGCPPIRWIKIHPDAVIHAFDTAYEKHKKEIKDDRNGIR